MLKGWLGEKKTQYNLWRGLDSRDYVRFHDTIFPSQNGTAQVDHLLVSKFGVFVVETKNYQGWIYGSEKDPKWTQTIYRKKSQFQNPLRQTYRHRKVIADFLDLDEACIHTIVSLVGKCEFKTDMPANVIMGGAGPYIKKHTAKLLSQEQVETVKSKINLLKTDGKISEKEHLESLNQRHTSQTVCPKCGSALVQRTVKKGPEAGRTFLGCEAYPKCRFSRAEAEELQVIGVKVTPFRFWLALSLLSAALVWILW